MPWVTAILAGLARLLGPLLIQFLISLGIGAVTYTGVKAVIDAAKSQAYSLLAGSGAVAVQVLSACKVDVAISILMGAVAIRLTLQGLTAAGSLTRFRLGGGSAS